MRGLHGLFVLLLLGPTVAVCAAEGDESFFQKSLHYTNRGIAFIYSKEHGGLERLTGMSAEQLGCLKSKCHVRSCDTCHGQVIDGKLSYSAARASDYEVCRPCHPLDKDDPDVHFKLGMKCMDCHSSREIHGDGTAWDTYMQPGALDTRCEKCHRDLTRTASHTVHGGKLDCSTCHALDFVTCINCHIDARLASGKDVSIERRRMFFLVNHDGKVTLGNFLTYVYGKKTMITLAPYFSHSIKKNGRACGDCHATRIVGEVKKGTFTPFSWKDGDVASVEGVIPVVEGMKWNLVFLARENDRWTLLADAAAPLVNFSGYCSPLSREQLARLERPQPGR
jgi:hypothetical protein